MPCFTLRAMLRSPHVACFRVPVACASVRGDNLQEPSRSASAGASVAPKGRPWPSPPERARPPGQAAPLALAPKTPAHPTPAHPTLTHPTLTHPTTWLG